MWDIAMRTNAPMHTRDNVTHHIVRMMTGVALLAVALLVAPSTASSQVRASELATVSQTIDGTRIMLEYSRPRARGRDTLFGTRAVHWGEVWTPGANWATTLDVSKPVTINRQRVPRGKYSVWFVVRKAGDWTMVLDTAVRRFHMNPPDTNATRIRIPVRPQGATFAEVLTWSFPAVRMNGTTLLFAWERVQVPIEIDVEPSLVTTLPAADAAPFIGSYTYTENDSLGKPAKVMTFTVTHEDGTLKGRFDPDDPYFRKFALVRIAPDWFVPGVYDSNGVLYEILKPDMVLEFTRTAGRATAIVVRYEDDVVAARAVRKPQ
jgi:hypothetical protein